MTDARKYFKVTFKSTERTVTEKAKVYIDKYDCPRID